MLTHHHEGEEHNLWPVIGDPAGGHEDDVAGLTHEHEEIVAGLAALPGRVRPAGHLRQRRGRRGHAAGLAQLREAATTHFAHEEAEMRGLMEAADPDRLAVALKEMGRDASAAQGMWFMQWVADGLTSQDSAELAGTIPAPVRMISKLVAGRKYGRVRSAAFA